MSRTIVFIGPTDGAAGTRLASSPHVTVAPPAVRGDVERAARSRYERIVLVDGYFYQQLSVGHRELRSAVESGIEVIGIASIGAIRAAELSSLGMRGHGRVYAAYASDPSLPNDDVALLHGPTPPYRATSEPLIHLRAWLASLTEHRRVTAADRDGVMDVLTACWFGDRTVARACRELASRMDLPVGEVRAWTNGFERYRWKMLDWRDFVATELDVADRGSGAAR